MSRRRSPLLLVLCALVVLPGCGGGVDVPEDVPPAPTPASGAVPWRAPANPLELTRKAGLAAETHEYLVFHVHAHLDVFVNGEPVVVPAGIGIAIDDAAVHHAVAEDGSDVYGAIDPPCAEPCISPLHTHDVTGVVHTESRSATPNTLGELFTEWDVALDASCVGGYCRPASSVLVYVDGKLYDDDPAGIELTDRKEIAIVIGTPPADVPSSFTF